MDTVQKLLILSGRVQGVGFRHFTRQTARELGVSGWVKNRKDGRVEALLQGPPARVEEMIDRLKKGPAGARVTDVVTQDAAGPAEYDRFEVRPA